VLSISDNHDHYSRANTPLAGPDLAPHIRQEGLRIILMNHQILSDRCMSDHPISIILASHHFGLGGGVDFVRPSPTGQGTVMSYGLLSPLDVLRSINSAWPASTVTNFLQYALISRTISHKYIKTLMSRTFLCERQRDGS